MRQLLIGALLLATTVSMGQDESFKDRFDRAKSHLVKYELQQATPLLRNLMQEDPTNANVRYLLGVCMSERDEPGEECLNLLSFGLDKIDQEYDPKSYTERDVPVYAYYFLTIAYSKEGHCDQAVQARKAFVKNYEVENDFYTQDAARWCSKCTERKKIEEIQKDTALSEPQIQEDPEVKVEQPEIKQEDPEGESDEVVINEMVTKTVSFTTPTPLWGVQIGAFSKFSPKNDFNYIRNVSAFLDNNGLVRYVIGCVTFKSQAERLLKAAKQNGIKDAFIVDINKTKKFSEEIISFNRQSLKAQASGSIDYRVQVGAFAKMNDKDIDNIYFGFQDAGHYEHQNMTMVTVGSFEEYNEASFYKDQVRAKGYKDAFIVAFRDNDRISVEEALLVEKQRRFNNARKKKKKRH